MYYIIFIYLYLSLSTLSPSPSILLHILVRISGRQESHKLKSKVNATLPVDPAFRGLESLAARKAQESRMISEKTYGDFHEWRYPNSGWFIRENPIKMDDLKVPPHFGTPPYTGKSHGKSYGKSYDKPWLHMVSG